jgi:hypothetical protein
MDEVGLSAKGHSRTGKRSLEEGPPAQGKKDICTFSLIFVKHGG